MKPVLTEACSDIVKKVKICFLDARCKFLLKSRIAAQIRTRQAFVTVRSESVIKLNECTLSKFHNFLKYLLIKFS